MRCPWLVGGIALVLGGCASPWGKDASVSQERSARQPFGEIAKAFPAEAATVGLKPPAAELPQENAMVASIKKGWANLTSPFRVEPKVIPAGDPTSLRSEPQQVASTLHYHAAKVHEAQGNAVGAMAHYQKALQTDPGDVRALTGYARVLGEQGNTVQAAQYFEKALELDPNFADGYNDWGLSLAQQGQFAGAADKFTQAVRVEPTNQRYRGNLAAALVDTGREGDAFRQLAEVHGEALAHFQMAALFAQRQRQPEAVAALQQALGLNPTLEPARAMLASLTSPVRPVR